MGSVHASRSTPSVYDWTGEGVQKINTRWLWIGEDGLSCNKEKGYMWNILKVYKVTHKDVAEEPPRKVARRA